MAVSSLILAPLRETLGIEPPAVAGRSCRALPWEQPQLCVRQHAAGDRDRGERGAGGELDDPTGGARWSCRSVSARQSGGRFERYQRPRLSARPPGRVRPLARGMASLGPSAIFQARRNIFRWRQRLARRRWSAARALAGGCDGPQSCRIGLHDSGAGPSDSRHRTCSILEEQIPLVSAGTS